MNKTSRATNLWTLSAFTRYPVNWRRWKKIKRMTQQKKKKKLKFTKKNCFARTPFSKVDDSLTFIYNDLCVLFKLPDRYHERSVLINLSWKISFRATSEFANNTCWPFKRQKQCTRPPARSSVSQTADIASSDEKKKKTFFVIQSVSWWIYNVVRSCCPTTSKPNIQNERWF